jgi:signal transduction histidine kinase
MKLEYLAENGPQAKTNLDAEIRHMSEVANESYDLMRGTLAALQVKASNGLYPLLAGHAQQVAERAAIQVEVSERGCPRSLSPNTLLQIFFIFREALSNIEKYAHATRVGVEIEWSESGLVLAIADNGCGFDMQDLKRDNHYGLNFMRERSECLNGHFSIDSARGTGTTIVIRL